MSGSDVPAAHLPATLDECRVVCSRARELQVAIDDLQAQQDALLDPVATLLRSQPPAVVESFLPLLPRGFYRTELRTWLNSQSSKPPRP